MIGCTEFKIQTLCKRGKKGIYKAKHLKSLRNWGEWRMSVIMVCGQRQKFTLVFDSSHTAICGFKTEKNFRTSQDIEVGLENGRAGLG